MNVDSIEPIIALENILSVEYFTWHKWLNKNKRADTKKKRRVSSQKCILNSNFVAALFMIVIPFVIINSA